MSPAFAPAPPVPISVLTGFLGSGKTTLLGRALQGSLSDTAVIINEIGSISLDHLVVEAIEGEILALSGGCLCCAIRQDVSRTLIELLDKARTGRVSPFRRVVIETSGLVDPAPLLYTLAADRDLDGVFALDSIVTVVDAAFGEATLREYAEARRQVAVADTIVLSKTDLTAPSKGLREAIGALNDRAEPIMPSKDDDPATLLFADAAGLRSRAARWFACEEVALPARHSADIASQAIALRRPVSRLDFATMLGRFAAARGEDLLRLKGLVEFTDRPGRPAMINAVQHAIYPPVWLDDWPSADQRNRLVLIGHGLGAGDILEAFAPADPEPLAALPRALPNRGLQCSKS